MTQRMKDLLLLLQEIQRLVQQNGWTPRRARIAATKSLASHGVTEQTIRDAYTPRRGSGGAADLDAAIRHWIAGDATAIKASLLRVAQGPEDERAVDSFVAPRFFPMTSLSTRELPDAVRLKETLRVSPDTGQGFINDSTLRKAIEDRAMQLAEEYYLSRFPSVQNTAKTESFDLRCNKDSDEVRVEVKGSTGKANEILVTVGEVENASGTAWRTDLFVASNIRVVEAADGPVADGGNVRVIESWRPSAEELVGTVFRYRLPK